MVLMTNTNVVEPKCNRCGNCCFLIDLDKMEQTEESCPFLIKLSDGSTKCKVYFRTRLGRNIGKNNKCNLRTNVKFNYPGCPYNVEGQVMIGKCRK